MTTNKFTFFFFIILLYNFCTSCSILKVHSVSNEFDGIKSSIDNKDVDSTDIRIFITHGVGPQELDFSEKFIAGIMKETNEYTKVASKTINVNEGRIFISQYSQGSNKITFYSVHWSNITEEFKGWLKENHQQTKNSRAPVNNYIQTKIMNENFSDFVLYKSPFYKCRIQAPIIEAMKYMYGYKDLPSGFISEIPLDNTDIYLVTGSLGTKIVFDVLNDIIYEGKSLLSNSEGSNILERDIIPVCIYPDIQLNEIDSVKWFSNSKKIALTTSIQKTTIKTIFSLSNQIPLLSVDELNASDGDNFKEYYQNNTAHICNFICNLNQDSFQLVGFYDPNDILGYALWASRDEYGYCENNSRLIVSGCVIDNARVWLCLFAHPKNAHVGGWKNKKIISMIYNGSKIK